MNTKLRLKLLSEFGLNVIDPELGLTLTCFKRAGDSGIGIIGTDVDGDGDIEINNELNADGVESTDVGIAIEDDEVGVVLVKFPDGKPVYAYSKFSDADFVAMFSLENYSG